MPWKKSLDQVDRQLTPKCKFQLGERVAGYRHPYRYEGIIIRAYWTINKGYWHNPAYILLCDDRKERSFQQLYKLPCTIGVNKLQGQHQPLQAKKKENSNEREGTPQQAS